MATDMLEGCLEYLPHDNKSINTLHQLHNNKVILNIKFHHSKHHQSNFNNINNNSSSSKANNNNVSNRNQDREGKVDE